jgi:hypothetical protein
MVGNLIHRKTDNTINKKRQTMVGNIMHRQAENTIINKDKQWSST